jgi:hypothetical protein
VVSFLPQYEMRWAIIIIRLLHKHSKCDLRFQRWRLGSTIIHSHGINLFLL